MDEESDERLMLAVQAGDHQAFAVLVRRHTKRFYAAAYRMCADAALSEDAVQEAFLKLWDRPDSWDAGKGVKFTTWFYKVVTNAAVDHIRRRKTTGSSAALDILEDERAAQDNAMAARQEEDILEDAIQALPERQRAAINLCVYEGLSHKEAAEALGVGVKALESLLSRAKAGLRDTLIREGIVEEDKEGKIRHAG